MEIKINSYSSQSSLISALLCFILGGIFYTNAETVLNFTSIAIGIILTIVGIFLLVIFYINYKNNKIYKGNAILGSILLILALIFLIFQELVELLLGLTIGGWILLTGILRLISAIKIKNKNKRFYINLIISALLIILGVYTIASGKILLETAGILMMVSSAFEIIGHIINNKLDSDEGIEFKTKVEEEIVLSLPDIEKDKQKEEIQEEIKLIPEDTEENKKPKKRRGRKKKVKDVKEVNVKEKTNKTKKVAK